MPKGLAAKIEKQAVRTLPIFPLIQQEGKIPERDMYNTFNMGVGMCIIVPADQADQALRVLAENGQPNAYLLGEVCEGEGVVLC